MEKNISIEYAKGRFLPSSKILTAQVYTKEQKFPDGSPSGQHVIRVAIELNTDNPKGATVYSDPFSTMEEARNFAINLTSC